MRALAPLAFAALLVGCNFNQDPAGADELWDRVHQEDYSSWASPPGYDTPQPSGAPHGGDVVIYIDETVTAALEGGAIDEWPVGSTIVKNGVKDGEIRLVSAMEKRDDGWFWAEWGADGSVKYSGAPGICTDCHASGSDFVRAFALPK